METEQPTQQIDYREIVALEPGERLDRAFVFDPVDRGKTSFRLSLVTKSLADGRVEMTAIGDRSTGDDPPERDFLRRARFPADALPQILEEFIERCGVDGALYREVPLDGAP